jgi:UDP-GlcNAc:undecaprenyl-phosphate GlcNAc-1-phosphate transferase
MGDAGAMLLGVLLATSTISLSGQVDPAALTGTGGLLAAYLPIVLPLAVLALPVLDLVLAYIRRTIAGTWWFRPDKKHLHHRLLQLGHSQTRAVLLMYLWTSLMSFGAIAIGFMDSNWWIAAVVVGLLMVAALLTILPRRRAAAARPPAHEEGLP